MGGSIEGVAGGTYKPPCAKMGVGPPGWSPSATCADDKPWVHLTNKQLSWFL